MKNLTQDMVLRGHEADRFMKSMLHPDSKCIERREEFIHSGNFRTEEKNGSSYVYDDGIDWSFLNTPGDGGDESCATLDEVAFKSSQDMKQIYIEYSCTNQDINLGSELLATMKKLQNNNISFNTEYIVNIVVQDEEECGLHISKQEIKYGEKMLDVSKAA